MTSLRADGLALGYEDRAVIDGLDLSIPEGRITAIVGPNACGKSTLLRGLARLLRPGAGRVLLDGADIHRLPTREVATRLGVLPQQPIAPDGITVGDLVARGRHPHQRWLRQWSADDERAVAAALAATELDGLAGEAVDRLSGGQRQRVWIALVLAQETDVLLLDEPTTFLDLAHQVEILDLLAALNRQGRTVVTVLHDLTMACRYADEIVVLCDGAVVAHGRPVEVIDAGLVERAFGLRATVIPDPTTGTPLVLPGSHTVRMDPLELITRYYDGCSTGDVDAVRATLHPDVVHWFLAPNPGSAPVAGDEHLARYWRTVRSRIDARWVVDHALCGPLVDGAGEAVIEWTMWSCPDGTGERVATRGAEWFTFEDGRIREIRSYYQQRGTTTELDAFDYAGRGWSVPGAERSSIHPAGG